VGGFKPPRLKERILMAASGSLLAVLDACPLIVERVTFGSGEAAFDVDIQSVDKSTLEAIANKAVRTVKRRGVDVREPNTEVFREQLRDHCLRGWSRFTYEKFLRACNRALPVSGEIQVDGNGTVKKLTEDVPYSPEEALVVLEHARGLVEDEVRNFDDWLYSEATRIADSKSAKEAVAKNG